MHTVNCGKAFQSSTILCVVKDQIICAHSVRTLCTCSSYLALHHVADPLLHGLPSFGSDQDVKGFDLRAGPQQLLHQHFSHEARGSRDQHILASVVFHYGRHAATRCATADVCQSGLCVCCLLS